MDKIYSRKRIKIPEFRAEENKILRKTLKTLLIVLIATIVIITILNSSTPIFEELCIDKAKSLATIISNEEATNVMKDYEYDDIITIHKDEQGNITMIESNIIVINKIISDVAIKIQNSINNNEENDIGIRLGSFTGSKLLSGRGPKVPIKISAIGNVETDFRSEFQEAGINQTLHRVYLDVKCEVDILTPFKTITKDIKNQVILAENIIVGKIPQTYYNLEGLDGKNEALEVIE